MSVGLPAEPRRDDPMPVLTVRDVFRTEGSFVLRILRRLGVPESDLDDAAQDVFVVVHRKLAEFEARADVKSWLFGIASRVALARRRRAHVRHEEARSDVEVAGACDDQDAETRRLDARTFLLRALDKLDDDKRAVFVLYELEGFSMQRIADAAGCPLQTAYSRLRHARAVVRAEVERANRGAL